VTTDPSIELNMRMPWLTAESESIWEITGTYPDGGSFSECLAQVTPWYVTGGPVLFQMLGGLRGDEPVSPDRITRAVELVLVYAKDPSEAYWDRDQQVIDQHRVVAP
jgi:hypothetical protein